MATANFGTPHFDLPLIAFGMSEDDFQNECEFNEAEELVKELNTDLVYMEGKIEGGYYQGAMFDFEDGCDYIDVEGGDLEDLEDEDAEYFYGDNAEQVRKDYKEDFKKIKAFLKDYKENYGGLELVRSACFSNGEVWYNSI